VLAKTSPPVLVPWPSLAFGLVPVKRAGGMTQPGGGEPARVDGAGLAEGDHFLGNRAGRFGLGQRGGHAFVLDETANQVRQHRVAVFAGAAKLGGSFPMTHSGSWASNSFGFFLGASSRDGSMFMPKVRP